MSRRGSNAVEFALLLPLLLILAAGVVDVGQYLFATDALCQAVFDGARAGMGADPDDGEDPLAMATVVAERHFAASGVPGAADFKATYAGLGAPDERIVLVGTLTFEPWFGFLRKRGEISYRSTLRLMHQP